VLGILAFAVVTYVTDKRGERSPAADALLTQPIRSFTAHNVPLQVAVHNLTESAGGAAVRVCLALADRSVSVEVTRTEPLHTVIEALAAQVGVTPLPAIDQHEHRLLLTIPCPNGPGDYLVIGSETRAREID
jgi:hypothetical protein